MREVATTAVATTAVATPAVATTTIFWGSEGVGGAAGKQPVFGFSTGPQHLHQSVRPCIITVYCRSTHG